MSTYNKIFGIGLSKTGTTSLFAALHMLGYRARTYRHLRQRRLIKWFNGNYLHDYLHDIDAVTDLPISSFYPALDERYPESKFILTTRNKSEWLESCKKYFSANNINLQKADLFRDFTSISMYGSITYNEAQFSYAYDCHEYGVRQYFKDRPEDLLTMSIVEGDGWEKLCLFLDKPIPKKEFPKVLPGGYLLTDELNSGDYSRRILGLKAIFKKNLKKLLT
ncbi:sulfotransferase family protein [Acaryochloris marina]|uniref:sulfotransferase family protein n=1 Tax=Acaryochloris marina TaxID=155978 RepID=UPI0021C4284A|nr:sulfotransferase family protein [Acaryochloris marina]BDM80317.1 hypothetical protein AM10699_31850 [Acaryochloris marina MBIC10699]